jgi:hypothetical protein
VILIYMLKWDHQPAKRSRSWAVSIAAQRAELEDVLDDNPGLKPRIGEAISRAHRKARLQAMDETGLRKSSFAEICPYSFDDITSRPFEYE